jgi:hypothetical protein
VQQPYFCQLLDQWPILIEQQKTFGQLLKFFQGNRKKLIVNCGDQNMVIKNF